MLGSRMTSAETYIQALYMLYANIYWETPFCFSNVSSNFDYVSCYCGASSSAAFLSGDTLSNVIYLNFCAIFQVKIVVKMTCS